MLRRVFILLSALAFFASGARALETKSSQSSDNSKKTDIVDQYQEIIDEYKQYLATIKPEVIEEIKRFRSEVAKINKQKRELYKALSQESQSYLSKESEFKRKLPMRKFKKDAETTKDQEVSSK